ncbi:MAG: HPr family phosphocarrier protein [Phycisphaerae bacterium]|nr:HPr family phosphocarrier protein [Phycisphaerae bacterium]MDW8261633.1 HPr family phosphocarrier protein [Phycisphaerales bacterium]
MKELPVAESPLPVGRLDSVAAVGKRSGAIGDCTMATACREIVVRNSMGLHARPAMQFVDLANTFKSNIVVRRMSDPPAEADGKSVMQMIILEATQGTTLRIEAEGEDAEQAVAELAGLFESKFGEE